MNKNRRLHAAASVVTLLVGLNGRASAQVTFEWVTVGNPGNAPDPLNEVIVLGIGSVTYKYRIAKHEVTNDQYAEFLNAVAATDTHALYNALMGSRARGGITQSGSSGGFTYAVKANMGNKPVNLVSFFDAMRFVNWLHNGQPTGAQHATTTEEGVYTISNGSCETRGCGAKFFIPTENEWYKAAYHQPSAGGEDAYDYWSYATASILIPTPATATATGDISNPGSNVVNYRSFANWNGQIGNLTTVGSAGAGSESFYGTSDQSGNVWEWNETVIDGSFRGLRGGWCKSSTPAVRSSWHGRSGPPTGEDKSIGFRVASPVSTFSADLDGDGDVDLFDYGLFQVQFTAPQ